LWFFVFFGFASFSGGVLLLLVFLPRVPFYPLLQSYLPNIYFLCVLKTDVELLSFSPNNVLNFHVVS